MEDFKLEKHDSESFKVQKNFSAQVLGFLNFRSSRIEMIISHHRKRFGPRSWCRWIVEKLYYDCCNDISLAL